MAKSQRGVAPSDPLDVVTKAYADGLLSNLAIIGASESVLGADVALTTSNQWYDGPTITLDPGTYVVICQLQHWRTATLAETIYCRISDGTNHYASGQFYHASLDGIGEPMVLTAMIVLTATTTIKGQATSSSGASTSLIKATLTENSAGTNASQIVAIKLGNSDMPTGQTSQIDLISGNSAGGGTLSGTWSKPTGAKTVMITTQAPGGAGGSGRKGAAASVRCGGGGGSGGGLNTLTFAAASLPDVIYYQIGAPGVGGAAQATNSTNGNAGGACTTHCWVSKANAWNAANVIVMANYGNPGGGGTNAAGTAGAGAAGMFLGGAGGAASTTGGAGANGASGQMGAPCGGGAGGGITTANAASAGGGVASPWGRYNQSSAGGAIGTAGAAGENFGATIGGGPSAGRGGSGGGSNLTGNGGNGGLGGDYGAGGGGGGAAVDSVGNSGKGGDGGKGYILIITEF